MVQYGLTELGTLGGASSCASAINAWGVVVGKAQTTDGAWRAVMWSAGTIVDLGRLPGTTGSEACSVNDGGQVVGVSFGGVEGSYRPFLWQDGEMVDLGDLGGSASASDVNAAGQMVGGSLTGPDPSSAEHHAALWVDRGALVSLGRLPGGGESHAWGINDAGLVVGVAESAEGADRAVLWEDAEITDLGTLGGADSGASAINARGEIAGAARTRDGALHACIWAGGAIADVGTLDGSRHSRALGINDRGQVVGVAAGPWQGGERHRAFLWRDRSLLDLSALTHNASGWELRMARGLNDDGQIVGEGMVRGHERGFLLTPDT